MRATLALTLSTLCLAACQPINTGHPRPPAEYLTCAPEPQVPDVKPLQVYVASNGAEVYLKSEVDARDAGIATYIVNWRGAWFSCSSQLQRVKDYEAGLEK